MNIIPPPTAPNGVGSDDLSLTSSPSNDCALVQLIARFSAFVVTQIEDNRSILKARDVVAEADRILDGAKERGCCAGVLVRSLLGHSSCNDPIATVKSHVKLLQRFTVDDMEAQGSTLTAVEEVISQRPELLCKTPRLFHTLYLNDIVDEDVFLEWEADHRDHSAAVVGDEIAESVRTSVRCFLEWLRSAETESDDDSDSDVEPDEPTADLSDLTDDEEECDWIEMSEQDYCTFDDGFSDGSLDKEPNLSFSEANKRNDSGICGSVPPDSSFSTPRPCSRVSFSDEVIVHTVPDEPRWGSWAADGIRERMEERRRKDRCQPSNLCNETSIEVEEH